MPNIELNRVQLEQIFPHKGRALMLDRAEIMEDGLVRGYHLVTEADCEGHFEGDPIYPGHWRIEQVALTLGLAGISVLADGQLPFLLKVGETRFPGLATLGDEVRSEARLTKPATRRSIMGSGKAFVDERLVAEVKDIWCLIGKA
jgi:3-hydroxymyristoyl/3-hydroxydecanoyl-(acyl carrier protein) dehydratase